MDFNNRVYSSMQENAKHSSLFEWLEQKAHGMCCVLYITTFTHTDHKQLCSNFSSEKQKHTPSIERQPTTIVVKKH